MDNVIRAGFGIFVDDEPSMLLAMKRLLSKIEGVELVGSFQNAAEALDIVFTTSHTDYEIEAYDVYPLDYMVKPISRQRLAQTISRAAARRSVSSGELSSDWLTVRGQSCFEASNKQAGAVKWISKKSMELFAYLIVNRGRNVNKARILEDIFPDMPLKNAETYLNTAVYQLRKALSQHGFKEMVSSA